ncbi:hypothetical protein [Megamonas hypermegale]|uniref:hypothetical protein n=1 Tax=Megamonas hypermegale TaxID=158847 RepID=UPI0026EC4F83|nr:hypothetical protein [Megamonas hypermegale]
MIIRDLLDVQEILSEIDTITDIIYATYKGADEVKQDDFELEGVFLTNEIYKRTKAIQDFLDIKRQATHEARERL